MQLQPQYPNLQQMYGDNSLFTTMYGQDQFNQAQAAAQQNLSQAQQDQAFQAQKLPGELALTNSQAANFNAEAAQGNARVPGITANSNMLQRQDQADAGVPMDQRVAAARQKLAASMTTDHLNEIEGKIKTTLADPNSTPQDRATAAQLWQSTSAIRQMKMEEQLRSDAQARAASIAANAGIKEEETRAASNERIANTHYGFDAMVRKGMTGGADQQAGALMMQANKLEADADQADDPAIKQKLVAGALKARQFAHMLLQQSITEKGAAAGTTNLGKIDFDAQGIPTLGGSGANPMPAPPPMPGVPNPTPAPKAQGLPAQPVIGQVYQWKDPKTGKITKHRLTDFPASDPDNWQDVQ